MRRGRIRRIKRVLKRGGKVGHERCFFPGGVVFWFGFGNEWREGWLADKRGWFGIVGAGGSKS